MVLELQSHLTVNQQHSVVHKLRLSLTFYCSDHRAELPAPLFSGVLFRIRRICSNSTDLPPKTEIPPISLLIQWFSPQSTDRRLLELDTRDHRLLKSSVFPSENYDFEPSGDGWRFEILWWWVNIWNPPIFLRKKIWFWTPRVLKINLLRALP